MGKKKRPFIDRKEAVSFRLLHRSQKDPLIADESAGERVFHPMTEGSREEGMEERHKYGIYYRDDYDYLKHLKEVGEAIDLVGDESVLEQEVIHADNPNNKIPSCVFETRGVELKVGMLNQAAPLNELLPDIDPDVAAALDGEVEDEDEELEDDFMQKANAGGEGEDEDDPNWTREEMRDERKGRENILQRFGLRQSQREKFSDESSEETDEEEEDTHSSDVEERKSKFTNYSMSSAVIKRPDGLRVIDDHFENLYAEQYLEEDEERMGEDGGTNGGTLGPESERFIALLEEQSTERQARYPRELPSAELKESVLRYAKAKECEEGDGREGTEHILVPADGAKRGRWDCESIISTYSTLYNHPTVIKETSLTNGRRKRKGITKGDLKELEKMEVDGALGGEGPPSTRTRTSKASSFRPRGETAEERRIRKQMVKEERRERRKEKKANRKAFQEKKLEMDAQSKQAQGQRGVRPIH